MKFKGIELKEGCDSESELFVNVEITDGVDNDELDDFLEEIEENITDAFENYPKEVYTEVVCENMLEVRCDEITFDQKGVALLTDIYNRVSGLDFAYINIGIGLHVDGEEWFRSEDDSEYNEDVVSMKEFLEQVEY